MPKFKKRTDANHTDICELFRDRGCSVEHMHLVGGGFPDIIVSYGKANALVEIKVPNGHLSQRQVEWHEKWPGRKFVVEDDDGVQQVFEYLAFMDSADNIYCQVFLASKESKE